ncbi:parallel beta helix pectate lyase-like protein [Geodermatophilus normandii]|uniref:Parallel beta helix pectate lyase-like protein n=1 Tax=Geodermatophilus normandii TaxID=1137989 RepID=A0A317QMV8_9ACTN|nr:right-handed parallel beta-helix repeat-containing protein [Geodermatophilus normandii]PWW24938.1 parallel beta helix pectate lyase-like protein [Geodermatophilus normandii]
MQHGSTAGRLRSPRLSRGLTITASAALVFTALPTGVAAATGGHTWVVHPGESIQAAVDQARSGDTIRIEAGTYEEAVCVVGKGLTVVGAGRGDDGTRITWPEWSTPDQLPDVDPTECWQAQNAADPESDPDTLADDVSGLFFLDPDGPVRVRNLSTHDHPANGIAAWGADGFRVTKTRAHGHERFGILAAASTHTRISRNILEGTDRGTAEAPNSGTAGIGITDSDASYADVVANDVQGYNIGVFARESRSGAIRHNYVAGNCVGILVFDDAATEIPDDSRQVAGGDWQLRWNEVTGNDRFCLAGVGEVEASLRVSGTGIGIVNADSVSVRHNDVHDNVPSVDPATLQFPAGGLVLVTLPPFNNPDGIDPGPAEGIVVEENTITGNVPVDVLLSSPQLSPFLGDVGAVDFEDNTCATSFPPGICTP